MKRFWMICRAPVHPGSVTNPQTRYGSEAEAIIAAQGMADKTGHPFVILTTAQTIHPKSDQKSLL